MPTMQPKILIVIIICLFIANNQVFAHKLPQQLNPQISEHNVASADMDFAEQEINQWDQYTKTLDIEVIAKRVNMPILVSYEVSSSTRAGLNNAECSIYIGISSDKTGLLCGDFDENYKAVQTEFMQAALAAIGFCHFTQAERSTGSNEPKHLVPYFKGPSTFVASMDETTSGKHHDEYQINHGLQFHCVEAYAASDVGKPASDDLNL